MKRSSPSLGSLFAALVLSGSLLISTPASACKCMFPPVETARDDATAVFEGRVLTIEQASGADPVNGERGVNLRVVRTWKGLEREEQVTVFTNGSSAACGYTFAQDTSYLIYARSSDDQKLHVSSCSRTKSLADSSEDLAFLGAGSTPVAIEQSPGTAAVAVADGGDGNLPPVVPASATPTAAVKKKKGCSIAGPLGAEDSSQAEGWLLLIPALALLAKRRAYARKSARLDRITRS